MTDDPGGIFATDTHRRVMAAVPNPDTDPQTTDELAETRIAGDDYLNIDQQELEDVLKDLEADGHVKQLKHGWKATPAGFEALTGPIAGDTP